MITKLPILARRWVLASLISLAANRASSATASDWRQFRGPDGQAVSRSQGLPVAWSAEQNIAWKTPLPGPGGSSPIVLGEHGYASSTPLADADRLYVFFGKSGVFAFSHDGQELWHADVGAKTHGWGSAASPVLYQDLVIINAAVESDSLVALNPQTGKEVWRAGGMKESWNTPILVPGAGGKAELVVVIMGKVLFEERLSGAGQCYASPMIADGKLYGVGRRGDVFVLAAKPQFEQLARNELGDRSSFDANPAVAGNRLLIRSDRFLYCIGAK